MTTKRSRKTPSPKSSLITWIHQRLDDMKAQEITILDVRSLTSMTDHMVICTGNSDRHVKAIAGDLCEASRQQGMKVVGVEGMNYGEWVLIDFGDAIVHVMQPATRQFYQLEKLWSAI